MNKKGQTSLTKTGILLVVVVFYSVLFVLIGYINSYFNSNVTTNTTQVGWGNSDCDCGVITCAEYRLIHGETALSALCSAQQDSDISFLQNVIKGINDIPWWLNTIIFTSLIIVLAWILLSSLPTFNGGG